MQPPEQMHLQASCAGCVRRASAGALFDRITCWHYPPHWAQGGGAVERASSRTNGQAETQLDPTPVAAAWNGTASKYTRSRVFPDCCDDTLVHP